MGRNGKIYIMPTGFGVLFFVSIVIMLLVGATYSNNLVNLLAFFLLAISLVAMVQTHNNLKNVRLRSVSAESGFAGSTITLITALENTGTATRFHIEARPERLRFEREPDNTQPLPSRATLRLMSFYSVQTRGRHNVRRLKITTVYPVGLFRAWMWLSADTSYLVYPRPQGDRPVPEAKLESPEGPRQQSHRGGEDFHGHREYRPGDSARRIDWKALARGRPLLVKEFDEGDPAALVFDYDSLHGLSREERLSQLSAWIETAKRQRLAYALRLPHILIPAGDDIRHHERCLEELATFPPSESKEPHADATAK